MRQLRSWGLALILWLICAPPAIAFSDTKNLAPLDLAAVEALSDMGIIVGYPDGTFRPEEALTRAEFAKMLCLFAAQDRLAGEIFFADVEPEAWYGGWVARAAQQGWVSGYPGGEYRPEAHLSQQELATVLLRVLGRETAGLSWPKGYITAARAEGLLEGLPFNPTAEASRMDICRIFYNILPGQSASLIADGLMMKARIGEVGEFAVVFSGEIGYNYSESTKAARALRAVADSRYIHRPHRPLG